MRRSGSLRRSRRAVSTLVGIAFFILLYFASLAAFIGVFNSFQSFSQTVATTTQANVARSTERVDITAAFLSAKNNLVLNMSNRGSSTVHLVGLWIVNLTDTANQKSNTHSFFNSTHTSNAFDFFIDAGSTLNYTSNVTLEVGKKYSIRVITEMGNSFSITLFPPSVVKFRVLVSVIPPSTLTKFNVTVIETITNNNTAGVNLYNLVPVNTTAIQLAGGKNCSPSCSLRKLNGPTPSNIPFLPPGGTGFFTWNYRIEGPTDTTARFNVTVNNAPKEAFAFANATIPITIPAGIISPQDVTSLRADIRIFAPATFSPRVKFSLFEVITNNSTDKQLIDVVPTLTPPFGAVTLAGPTPSKINVLAPGASAVINYTVRVDIIQAVTFVASFTNGPNGNVATTTITPLVTEQSLVVTKPITLISGAFANPNPIVDGVLDNAAYWSIVVANPTNASVNVFAVTISTTQGRFAGDPPKGGITGISPTQGWQLFTTVGAGGQPFQSIVWSGTQVLPKQSVFNFTVLVNNRGGDMFDQTPIIVGVNGDVKLFTTFTLTSKNDASISAAWFIDSNHPKTWAYNGTTAVISGQSKTFTLNIMNNGTSVLPNNSVVDLTIRLPVGWTSVSASGQTGWASTVITTDIDGSTRIRVTSTGPVQLGNQLTYQFSAIAPTISVTTLYQFATLVTYPGATGLNYRGVVSADLVIQVKPS